MIILVICSFRSFFKVFANMTLYWRQDPCKGTNTASYDPIKRRGAATTNPHPLVRYVAKNSLTALNWKMEKYVPDMPVS